MEPEKAKTIISTLFSIRIHENLFEIVDKCIEKSRWEINNIVKSETEDKLTEFGQGGLAAVIFVLVGEGNKT
jgi:hypothetical protein